MRQLPNLDDWSNLSSTIALDYETTGLDYWSADFRILGVAIATESDAWYFELDEEVVLWLRRVLPGREIVAQFAQFEIQCSRILGIDPRTIDWYCTMTVECLIDEHHLTYDLYSIAGYHGLNSQKKVWLDRLQEAMGLRSHSEVLARLQSAPPELVAGYGASDARDAFDVYLAQQPQITEQQLEQVVRLERDLTPVLADMSWGGIRVDLEAAHAAIPVFDDKIEQLQKEVNQIAGGSMNVNSSPQIKAFFKPTPVNKFQWQLIDGTLVGGTKGNKGPSLDAKAMLEIKHPLAKAILALRKSIKLRDTFLKGHIIGSADAEGYVHTTFNQTRNDADAGTVTGRLSSTGPALQQITARDIENARILRSKFLADEDEEWLCVDHSQIDFRCGAHLQNDPSVIAAYWADPKLDYHQIVSDMTGIPRNAPFAGAPYTKQINLGLSFGAGMGKLAFMMNMPYTVKEGFGGRMQYVAGPEAEAIFRLYHKKLPAVQKFMKKAENVAKTSHYVRTAIGRRLRFPRGIGAHKAAGLLYQAYAADIHKHGLVAIDRAIRVDRIPARLMMSCHDEVGISSKPDEEIRRRVIEIYTDFSSDTSPIKMRIPITASGDYGVNWFEASKK